MSFRLTINPALEEGDNTISFTYLTSDLMEKAADSMANMLLFLQDGIGVMPDYSNMFIKEQYIDGEWQEIEYI